MPSLPPDTEGLHAIANTTRNDRVADIVFVHGLGGSSHKTWRHGEEGTRDHFFWPEELGKELPQCGMWSVGYPAGFTAFGNPGMVIGQRGLSLADELRVNGVGSTRPLLFVTHSMGGLVVKALIDGCHCHVLPQMEQLVLSVKGIAFCGTPHFGSSFASAAERLSYYFAWAAQEHVREMEVNAKGLELLHYRFMGWLRSHPAQIHCFAESVELGKKSNWFSRMLPIGVVVPTHSAVISGLPFSIIDQDHIQLVKPCHRHSHIYLGVREFILRTLPDVVAQPSN